MANKLKMGDAFLVAAAAAAGVAAFNWAWGMLGRFRPAKS